LAIVVTFAVLVSLAFASINALTDVMLGRLIAEALSRLPRKKRQDSPP
jgi:hypothetical protein